MTCLATGADQVFARAVRAVGGTYEVILPAPDYRDMLAPDHRAEFDQLLAGASRVIHTGLAESGTEAYAEASRLMLTGIDRLLAVWDGTVRGQPGGTADVVCDARRLCVLTTVVWPAGSTRT